MEIKMLKKNVARKNNKYDHKVQKNSILGSIGAN